MQTAHTQTKQRVLPNTLAFLVGQFTVCHWLVFQASFQATTCMLPILDVAYPTHSVQGWCSAIPLSVHCSAFPFGIQFSDITAPIWVKGSASYTCCSDTASDRALAGTLQLE